MKNSAVYVNINAAWRLPLLRRFVRPMAVFLRKLARPAAVLALCLCPLVLTACHGSKGLPEFEIPDSLDTSRNIDITFWAKNDTNKTQTDIYARAIEEFEALYPNIHVNIRLYTDYSRIYNDVITNISTATTPNVCITYPDHIATYLTGSNNVVPLDELFTDPRFGFAGSEVRFDAPSFDQVINKYLDECMIRDKHYAVPFMRSTEACYINKNMVEALGYTIPDELTWDFVWEVSDAAMAKNPDGTYAVNGQNVLIPFIYKSTDNMMIQQLKQKNAGYSTPEADILLFNDTAFDLLYEIADHVGKGAFSTFKISSYPGNFLNAGQCIFAIDSTAGATWMGTLAPHSDIAADMFREFETVVKPIPQFDPAHPQMISQGPSVCVFNKADPQEVLASWLFVQYLLTDGIQISYSQTEGYIPVTSKARENPEYLDYLAREGEDEDLHYNVKLQAAKLLLDNIDNTFITPVFNGSASVRDAAGQMIENVAKSVRRGETVDAAYMEQLEKDITSLYRLDQLKANNSGTEQNSTGSSAGKGASQTELPAASKALLITLCVVWILLAAYGVYMLIVILKKRKKGL